MNFVYTFGEQPAISPIRHPVRNVANKLSPLVHGQVYIRPCMREVFLYLSVSLVLLFLLQVKQVRITQAFDFSTSGIPT